MHEYKMKDQEKKSQSISCGESRLRTTVLVILVKLGMGMMLNIMVKLGTMKNVYDNGKLEHGTGVKYHGKFRYHVET